MLTVNKDTMPAQTCPYRTPTG